MWGNEAASPPDSGGMMILRNDTIFTTGSVGGSSASGGHSTSGQSRNLVLWPDDESHPCRDVPGEDLEKVYDVAVADLDNDGDADMVAARLALKDLTFLNHAGRFVTGLVNDFEESEYPYCIGGGTGGTAYTSNEVCSTDPSAEFDPDVALCNRRWTTGVSTGDLDLTASWISSCPIELPARVR